MLFWIFVIALTLFLAFGIFIRVCVLIDDKEDEKKWDIKDFEERQEYYEKHKKTLSHKIDNNIAGEWYEIARFDHSFERGVEQAKANYTQNADGTIKVVNSGIKNGKPKTAVGKGKTTDTPGLLRVSFFGPFYADYRVMLIDKDYTRALVGSGSADYLWILSRTSGLSETAKAELLSEAKRRGYDTGKLIWVEQK